MRQGALIFCIHRLLPLPFWCVVLTIGLASGGIVLGADSDQPAPQTQPAPTATQPATSQPAEAPTSQPATVLEYLQNTEHLTGDWFGGRTWLEEHGLTISLSLTTIYQQNAHGGANTHRAADVTGSDDLELTADLEKMKLIPGGKLYAHAESSWGRGIGGDVGDLFGTNADAGGDRSIDLTELWYEQTLLNDKLRIRLGKFDPTTDFDTNAFANDETLQFLNNSLVNNQTIPFPDNGLGIQAVIKPCDWLYLGGLVMDANGDARETGFRTAFHGPDNFFSIYEFGLTPTLPSSRGDLPGSYRFGLWYDPQPKEQYFNDLKGRLKTAPIRTGDVGFYVSFDQMLWKENAEQKADLQGLGMFFRYGYAHQDVNPIENFWSVGGQYRGLIPTRDDDVLAFGVGQGILSSDMKKTGVNPGRETCLETYYSVQIFKWLTLSPDFQWVLNPGGTGGRDAFVAGLRLQASF